MKDCHESKPSAPYRGPRTAISHSKTCIREILAGCRLPDDPFLRSIEVLACIIIWNRVKFCHLAPVQVCEQTFPVMQSSAFIVFVRYTAVGRDDSIGIATRYGVDVSGIESRWGWGRFSLPFQSSPGAGCLSQRNCGKGVALTTHPYLAPRLRKE